MVTDDMAGSGWVKEYSSTLFFGAGVLMLAALSISQLRDLSVLSSPQWVHNLLGPLGVAFTAYGLLVFYPWVADAAPRLARASAGLSLIASGAISVAILGASGAAVLTETTITSPPDWVPVFYFLTIVCLSLGFLLYGIASVRTRVPSRSVGLAMLVPAVMLAALFIGETMFGLTAYLPRVVFITTPGFLILLGFIVRVGTRKENGIEFPIESPI